MTRRGTGSIQWITALALLSMRTVTSWAPTTSIPLRKTRSRRGNTAAVAMSALKQTTGTSRTTTTANEADHHEQEPCNVVFTHTNADFDSLAAAVALSLLWKHENPSLPTHVVLPRGVHPVVQRFLAFHKHLLPLRGFKTILPEDVHAIGVVDAQDASRIGRGQSWLSHAQSIHIYDHHEGDPDTNEKDGLQKATLLELASEVVIDQVGSTTTLLVERLKEAGICPAPHEATLFVLGIRADTGGLVYEGTTIRDAAALLWCLENGASQVAISQFGVAKVSETQRTILHSALGKTETKLVGGLRISSVLVTLEDQYVAGLAQICEEIMDLTDSDVFLLGATHRSGSGKPKKGGRKKKKKDTAQNAAVVPPTQWISLIGRASARAVGVDLNAMMRQFGGGGHPKAAAAALRCSNCPDLDDTTSEQPSPIADLLVLANEGKLVANETLGLAISIIETQIPEQLVASSFMVPISQIVTVDKEITIAEARLIFDNHNLKSVPVVDSTAGNNRFRSSLKLNDLVKASRAGRSNEKLKGMLRPSVKTVLPDTNLADLEHLLVNEGIGRIPVVDDDGILLGIVTRTDVLRQHKLYDESNLIDLKLAKD
eukprot:CAMPEP_0195523920 /NCGR_PEP_ID=MMETSP0794_2-20130614/23435_1 /TAXON_ID=515487 /ORGANISM="Stephanopyxis turris, Strain CCMP 815" /LENGTH=599 /DNA_ID=CAMNT_0040654025 /DNA_START=58 /DNA_END=1857 /DNA_ORIENTATION=+